MKLIKSLVTAFGILVFACGANANNVFYEASGTTDYTISFRTMAQGFAVFAPSNPVTVYAYVGTTAVDTMYIDAGNSQFFYCPANRLSINRTLATSVTINPTYLNGINPNLGMAMPDIQTALDSIATAAYSPSPVTFSDPVALFNSTIFTRAGNDSSMVPRTLTYPVIGENVTGATSLLCYANWDQFKGQFSIQMCVGPSGAEADTFLTYPIDSTTSTKNFWRIDSLTTKQSAYEGFVFRISNDGHPFCGYLRGKVVVDAGDDLRGFELFVIKEYGGM